MSKCDDLVGQKFGRLTVISRAENVKRLTRWNCICECGNSTVVYGGHLRSGATKSCGCLCKETASKNNSTHRKTKTRLFTTWQNMFTRCNNKNHKQYKNYGARGIQVCDEWKDFVIFYEWAIQNGYNDNLTIDRIDNDGNYCPENCQWITLSENVKKEWRKRKNEK